MSGFLFSNIIFGPVNSRRLGLSLGVNLLPVNSKLCNFNCIYCECGLTHKGIEEQKNIPSRNTVRNNLESSLIRLRETGKLPDSITFAGNGEPTLHPDFASIIDDTMELRSSISPNTEISVLTNATTAGNNIIINALKKVDKNIMKLDAGTQVMFETINRCKSGVTLSDIVKNMTVFDGKLIVQSLFVRGNFRGAYIDNTITAEINEWLKHLARIRPENVMIYPIARETPLEGLEKISKEELNTISSKVHEIGLNAEVYY